MSLRVILFLALFRLFWSTYLSTLVAVRMVTVQSGCHMIIYELPNLNYMLASWLPSG